MHLKRRRRQFSKREYKPNGGADHKQADIEGKTLSIEKEMIVLDTSVGLKPECVESQAPEEQEEIEVGFLVVQ